MQKLTVLLIGMFLFYSCNQQGNEKNKEQKADTPLVTDTNTLPDTTLNREETIIQFPDSSRTIIDGHIHGLHNPQVYIIEAKKDQKIKAELKTKKTPANIQFGQIISPSGISDGPFGIKLEYTLKETGKWKLIVNESNMIGDNYKGDYQLDISLK